MRTARGYGGAAIGAALLLALAACTGGATGTTAATSSPTASAGGAMPAATAVPAPTGASVTLNPSTGAVAGPAGTTASAKLDAVLATVRASRKDLVADLKAFRTCWQRDGIPCAAEVAALETSVRPLMTLGPTVPDFGIDSPNGTGGRATPPPATSATGGLIRNAYDSARTVTDQAPRLRADCADPRSVACVTSFNAINDAASVLEGNAKSWEVYYVTAPRHYYVGEVESFGPDLMAATRAFRTCHTKAPGNCTEQANAMSMLLGELIGSIGETTAPPPGLSVVVEVGRELGPPPASIAPLVRRTVTAAYRGLDAMASPRCAAPNTPCPAGERGLADVAPELLDDLGEWKRISSYWDQ